MNLKQRFLNWWNGIVELPPRSLIINHLEIDGRDQLIGPVPADWFVYGESPELQCETLSAGKWAAVVVQNDSKFSAEVTMTLIGRTDALYERVILQLGRKTVSPGAIVEFTACTNRDMVPYRFIIFYPTHVKKS